MEALLEEIRQLRAGGSPGVQANGFVAVEQGAAHGGTAPWADLFQRYFVDQAIGDDLLFFVPFLDHTSRASPSKVRLRNGSSGSVGAGTAENSERLHVFRRHSETRPLPKTGSTEYNWEETVCLNLVLQGFQYDLTLAVCNRDARTRKLKVMKKFTQQVYASPSKRSMDVKGPGETITFPLLYFNIDNFDEVFEDIVVAKEQSICVEVVASVPQTKALGVVFGGSVTHGALVAAYNNRKASRSWTSRRTARKVQMEFLNMKGPKGLGQAEMAVSIATSPADAAPASAAAPSKRDAPTKPSLMGSLVSAPISSVVRLGAAPLKALGFGGPATNISELDLNAFLTYVSQPWETLLDSVIVAPSKPMFSRRKSRKPSAACLSLPTAQPTAAAGTAATDPSDAPGAAATPATAAASAPPPAAAAALPTASD